MECVKQKRQNAVQKSHLRLLRRAPVEGEKGWWGGRVEGDEWQGGTGGRVGSFGTCLRETETERETEKFRE